MNLKKVAFYHPNENGPEGLQSMSEDRPYMRITYGLSKSLSDLLHQPIKSVQELFNYFV